MQLYSSIAHTRAYPGELVECLATHHTLQVSSRDLARHTIASPVRRACVLRVWDLSRPCHWLLHWEVAAGSRCDSSSHNAPQRAVGMS